MPRRGRVACTMMSRDIRRLGTLMAEFAAARPEQGPPSGAIFGPPGHQIFYRFGCRKPQPAHEFGPGRCAVYEIEREGTGVGKLRHKDSVGNIYGLATQLSRDITRLWGCKLGEERGFEGARRRRR